MNCRRHGQVISIGSDCPLCLADRPKPSHAPGLTVDDRIHEAEWDAHARGYHTGSRRRKHIEPSVDDETVT